MSVEIEAQPDAGTQARQTWLRVLSSAPLAELEHALASLERRPPYVMLRPPQIGLVMVRGRAGGTGAAFNLGEMTVTRCTLRLDDEADDRPTGVGYVAGRSSRRSELVALCDAMLQTPRWHERVRTHVLEPLERFGAERRAQSARRRAATRAEFVTVVRSGEA